MKRQICIAILVLLLSMLVSPVAGQQLVNNFPGSANTQESLGETANNAFGLLVTTVNSSATTIVLDDASKFSASGAATFVDSGEIFKFTRSGNTLTATLRGADGTTAASHLSGVKVAMLVISGYLKVIRDTLIAHEVKIGTGADTPTSGEFFIGTGTGTTGWRAMLGTDVPAAYAYFWSGLHTFNVGTTPADVIFINIAQPGSAGTRNSHNFVQRGTSYDTTGHNADWKCFVNVTTNAGASTWKLQSRIDGGSFTDRLSITDGGLVGGDIFNAGTGFRLSGAATSGNVLRGNGTNFVSAQLTGADLSMSDVTTNDVSTTRHGFAPKAPNDTTKFLDGTGAYTQARPYKIYVALLSQNSTNAPTATVLENTLGGTVTWARTAQGVYTATLSGVFTANKTMVFLGAANAYSTADGAQVPYLWAARANNDSINFKTAEVDNSGPAFQALDGVFNSTEVEIRVYP